MTYAKTEQFTLYHGDNREVLKQLAENSVDSIVTDPPYELGFMGKSWDASGVAFDPATWREALRVLKPGGHLIAFSGSRTYHRMAVAIEDAGFEIRDQIMWIYGSGFPKSYNIAKGIEGTLTNGSASWNKWHELNGELSEAKAQGANGLTKLHTSQGNRPEQYASHGSLELQPTTDEAKQWQGWGTALKPAHEPIVLARKPLIGTVAANVLTYGTGGLNIDKSRVSSEDSFEGLKGFASMKLNARRNGETEEEWKIRCESGPEQQESLRKLQELGRWPANVIHDGSDEVVELFPNSKGGAYPAVRGKSDIGAFALGGNHKDKPNQARVMGDDGSAARFFYCAKASKRDRNEGLDGFEVKQTLGGGGLIEVGGAYGSIKAAGQNHHPTVKPTELMRYLCRMVTPPSGTVLDLFMGSGSTGKAAIFEGFKFIGIEMTDEYLPIAKARIEFAIGEVSEFLL